MSDWQQDLREWKQSIGFSLLADAQGVEALALKVYNASEAYYNGQPIMSDAEWDAAFDELRKLNPTHPVVLAIGAQPRAVSAWKKVSHRFPMLSLNKAQEYEEVLTWLKRFPGQILLVMDKLDGISLDLKYDKGKLVQAATRGDGDIGEEITSNVRRMQGVPSEIPFTEPLHIRGEIVCTRPVFKQFFAETAANPRNIASGVAKRLDGKGSEHLTVITYAVYGHPSLHTRSASLDWLAENGFQVVWSRALLPFEDKMDGSVLESLYQTKHATRIGYYVDIDGLVLAVDDLTVSENAGLLNSRPAAAIAFKFPHDAAVTTLRGIQWQVGGTGRITPVAFFDPISLAGATVKQASLHNIANISRLNQDRGSIFRVTDKIRVSRRNDVIPYVEALVTPAPEFMPYLEAPLYCPSCNGGPEKEYAPQELVIPSVYQADPRKPLIMVGEYLVCPCEDTCPAQGVGRISTWIKKLNILDWGDAVIEALVTEGLVSSVPDLYRLTAEQLAGLQLSGRVLGRSMADRLVENLHAKKALGISDFLGSLNIPLWGRSMIELVASQGVKTLEAFLGLTEAQLCKFEGVQEKKASELVQGLVKRKGLIEALLAVGVSVVQEAKVEGPLKGKLFCFTGFRDKDREEKIRSLGGEVKDNLTSSVTHLVAKSLTSTSSKIEKAKKAGTQVLDLASLDALLGAS